MILFRRFISLSLSPVLSDVFFTNRSQFTQRTKNLKELEEKSKDVDGLSLQIESVTQTYDKAITTTV